MGLQILQSLLIPLNPAFLPLSLTALGLGLPCHPLCLVLPSRGGAVLRDERNVCDGPDLFVTFHGESGVLVCVAIFPSKDRLHFGAASSLISQWQVFLGEF